MKPGSNLFGAFALAGGLAVTCLAPVGPANGQAFQVLYSFCSQQSCTDGRWPYAGLLTDNQGNLFGTTGAGGIASCRIYGCGTVFKLAPDGTETVLHAFSPGNDGSGPYGGLIADIAGNFYGTTAVGGGTGCGGSGFGCGTVFSVTPGGQETVLYAFGGNNDGAYPMAGLVSDANGVLYGTTQYGGGGTSCTVAFGGCGTIFSLAPNGTETVLYAFGGGNDGAFPMASLIADANGNLYGTATYGGNSGHHCMNGPTTGCGVVFKLGANGHEKTLYAFQGGSDGSGPASSLIEDASGNFYGTTEAGGGASACAPEGCGTVFEIAPDGTETLLYIFTRGADGAHPSAALIADTKGNFYGTTYSGGAGGAGTAFKLAPGGVLTVLNGFTGAGASPVAPLVAGANRILYGTTEFGPYGTIYKVKK